MGGYVNTAIIITQGLLLIPLYLHYIGAHTYGIWLASGGMLGMLGLMNFGISSLLVQRIARAYAKQNLSRAGAYFINGALIYLGISLLYATVGWFLSVWLPVILKLTGEDAELIRQCFQLAVVAMVIGVFNECLRSFCQALLRPVMPAVSIMIGRISGIGLTIWMLFNDFGLWAIPLGTLITECIIFILNLLYAFALFLALKVRVKFDLKIITEYLKTSPVLLMARVGNTVSKESEPLLITMFLSPELTTAYMVTRKAADIVLRLLNVVVGSTMSTFAHLAGSGDRDKASRVAKKLLILSFSIGAICFATYVGANHAFVSLWVGELFVLDQNVILFIALGFFARTLRGLLGQLLYGLGGFTYPSMVILLDGMSRIVLAIGLISVFGVIGMPIAVTVTSMIAIIALGLRLNNELVMHANYSAIVRFVISSAIVFAVSMSLTNLELNVDTWLRFTLYMVLLLSGALALYVLMNWANCRDVYKSITA